MPHMLVNLFKPLQYLYMYVECGVGKTFTLGTTPIFLCEMWCFTPFQFVYSFMLQHAYGYQQFLCCMFVSWTCICPISLVYLIALFLSGHVFLKLIQDIVKILVSCYTPDHIGSKPLYNYMYDVVIVINCAIHKQNWKVVLLYLPVFNFSLCPVFILVILVILDTSNLNVHSVCIHALILFLLENG